MRRASPNLSMRNGAKSGHRANVSHLDLQPDAMGVATRLAEASLREAGIVLKPLLRSAGLSAIQINNKDVRIGVASQIRFLELAAKALNDPLLGFRLTRDADLRFVGLLYYVAASSQTLGDALERAERRLAPKKYGDQISHDGHGGAALNFQPAILIRVTGAAEADVRSASEEADGVLLDANRHIVRER